LVTEASLTWTGSCVNRLVPVVGGGAAEVGGDTAADGELLPTAPDPPEPEPGLGLELAELPPDGELTPAPGERAATAVPALGRVTTSPAIASRATRNRLRIA